MADDDLAWLTELDASIWREVEHRMRANMTGHEWISKGRRVERKMTAEEWECVQAIIRDHGLLTSMHNTGFGFTCGMAVYEHPTPIYPGVPLTPRRLLFVESHHLPVLPTQQGGPGDGFEAGWAAFSPFTHSEQNAAWLRQYGMESPQSKGHYAY